MTAEAAVALTPHPLQRVGAFALARLADVSCPEDVGELELARAVSVMHDDLYQTTDAADSKAENGFWLGASYLFWPNSGVPNTTNRKKMPVEQRREALREWRTLPAASETIGAPCALCGRDACGFYGKVDVALGASVNYRNTTPRGHDGLALCRGCLACFYALPYGCAITGGRAAVLHSWDDRFLERTTGRQVHRMRQDASVGAGSFGDSRPYARQVAALRLIRGYEYRISAGVDLMVFSNSNKQQVLEVHAMAQPLAEWVRVTRYQPEMADGWRYLKRAHSGPKMPGLSVLARNLFDQPRGVISRVAGYARGLAEDPKIPPGEAPALAVICRDYAMRVLGMEQSDAEEIRGLARNVAGVAGRDRSEFMTFVVACRKNRLRQWLRDQAVDRVRHEPTPGAFVSERQWRLLFSGDDGFTNRELLLICVLEEVHALAPQWRGDNASARDGLDDELDDMKEKEEEGPGE